jgi:ribosomal protein S3AE
MEFIWHTQKDIFLRQTRSIGFQDIIYSIASDGLLDDIAHPNQLKYPLQRIMIVKHGAYVYQIPYVIGEGYIFLKTIIPSRKSLQTYL